MKWIDLVIQFGGKKEDIQQRAKQIASEHTKNGRVSLEIDNLRQK